MSVLVAGVDEVGRGPLAGPVVACAVILLEPIEGIADSKALKAQERERLAAIIRTTALVGLAAASVEEIGRLNILHASLLAMRRAVARLPRVPAMVLVDGNRPPALGLPTRCIVGGDASEPAIGAASIVAKVARDRLMARLAARWPGYGFERNAGYPTPEHQAALRRLGLTPHHRRGFAPCAQLVLEV
ncbi:MAG: ribonuclease HII [Geminicoccaceae bacterium]